MKDYIKQIVHSRSCLKQRQCETINLWLQLASVCWDDREPCELWG